MIKNSLNLLKNIPKSSIPLINGIKTNSSIFTNITSKNLICDKNSMQNDLLIKFNSSRISLFKNNFNGADKTIKQFNNNRFYSSFKQPPPPLSSGRGPIVVKSKKEAFVIYITMLLAIACLSILYYIWYLKYKRLELAKKSIEELENLTEDDIRKLIEESKLKKKNEPKTPLSVPDRIHK
ncbi:hypothetical protein RB653_008478 [Dictyostelium firmibasis]|uniref:Transmembrane protein n=1 Tax=Dictyostelium firmibasis TaxID=79012 RepID=A0AAN7U4T1_9MYCE